MCVEICRVSSAPRYKEPARWRRGPVGIAQLGVDQAVADYASLIDSLRRNHSAPTSPVVASGWWSVAIYGARPAGHVRPAIQNIPNAFIPQRPPTDGAVRFDGSTPHAFPQVFGGSYAGSLAFYLRTKYLRTGRRAWETSRSNRTLTVKRQSKRHCRSFALDLPCVVSEPSQTAEVRVGRRWMVVVTGV